MYSRKHYLEVLKEAEEKLLLYNIESRARVCGFSQRDTPGGNEISFDHLGTEFKVILSGREIHIESEREMPLIMRVIVLHHLLEAGAAPLSGELAPLKDFPGLESYGATIRRRTEAILARSLGDAPERLIAAATLLGGASVLMGDAAARLFPLPRVPVVVVVNAAEEGLPASANLLYDRSAASLLPLEDMVVLGELISRKLANVANKIKC
jgi:hypothetical protein